MAGVASASTIRKTRWILPAEDARIPEFARNLGLHLPAAQVLWNRGYRTSEDVTRYLQPNLDDLHDPMLLRDMDRAAARLRTAVERKEKILLYGDYDVDGTTSIVVLKKALDLA